MVEQIDELFEVDLRICWHMLLLSDITVANLGHMVTNMIFFQLAVINSCESKTIKLKAHVLHVYILQINDKSYRSTTEQKTRTPTFTMTTTSLRKRSHQAAFNNYINQSYHQTPPQRLLLRQWLEQQVDKGDISGLVWINPSVDVGYKTMIRIPWTHGSRQGFDDVKDVCLFERWAMHTGN